MFQLTKEIRLCLKSQIATLNSEGNKRGMHIKKLPYAFTEQGVYMLATVLKSDIAIKQSIMIIRVFKDARNKTMINELLNNF